MRFFLVLALLLLVGGCQTPNEIDAQNQARVQAAKDACRRNSKTNLALAKCEDALILGDVRNPANLDLVLVLTATRENVADKLDRKIITDQEAKVEMATAYSQLLTTAQQRNLSASQAAAANAEIEAASRPPVVVEQMQPTPVRCLSSRFGNTVATNCF